MAGRVGVEAVLFDLDGTLLDSIDGIIRSFTHVLGRHLPGHSFTRRDMVLKIGEPVPVQMLDFAAGDADVAARMTVDYRAHNMALLPSVPLYPRVKETLAELRSRGFVTGLVTSKSRRGADISLDGHGLMPLFDLIMTADDTPKHKPDPMPLVVASERLGLDPRSIVYVGDSVHDLRCAQGAGAIDVAALWGPFERETLAALKPRYMVQSLDELAELAILTGRAPAR